jgi:F-type H+-transporting ATPase subunit a
MSYISELLQALKASFVSSIKIGNIGEEISKVIIPREVFSTYIGGVHVIISDAVIATWVAMVVIAAGAYYMGHKPQRIPDTKRQQLAETLVDILLKLCQSSNMSYEQSEQIVPYVGTIAIFISITNLATMFKIAPPAKNLAFPVALALFTIGYVILTAIHFVGLKGFWHSLAYPKKILLPFKILDYIIKPVSLSMRLFGNVFGAFILMEFIYLVVPIILPGVVGLWFDLADGILQGVIFTYLAVTYIGEVIEGAHMAAQAQELEKHQAQV